jgi:hypothetical protein
MSKPFDDPQCTCRGCGLKFSSVVVFDKHRVGDFTNEAPKYGRRCLTEPELRAVGMEPDGQGYWRTTTWGKKTPMIPPSFGGTNEEMTWT